MDQVPGTPEWWLARLEKKLNDRQDEIEKFTDYYDGKQPLAFASLKFQQAFGGLFEDFADNWCQLVVDAAAERLNVEGFRIPTGTGDQASAENAMKGDQDAWRMWQANNLDAESQMAFTDALVAGEVSALVAPNPKDDKTPRITFEHPLEMIVEDVTGTRRVRAAALKRWTDEDGFQMATLYLPDKIYKFVASRRGTAWKSITRWEPRIIDSEDWPLNNPLGVVPVVTLANRPRLLVPGQSEIARVIPLQDAVNKLLADLLVASEYASFRQRWATGIDIPKDPETGEDIEPFEHAINRLWAVEDKDAKFGDFSETDLEKIIKAIEMGVQHIASQTRTPPHYFYLSGQMPSGESIKSAETGLVAKARRIMRPFGEGCEEIIRLGFAILDDPRSKVTNSQTIWGDPESRSESEHIDALSKMKAIGVPDVILWEKAGFTPQEITRMLELGAPPKDPAPGPAPKPGDVPAPAGV